ncbi:hypothetical protein OG539_12895 [Actinacidiphila glaucinigra]|uniref:hypothetical protein n=1 Tax=Actinacidiphila glaucinigra TaxID=235986 RepID=UPI002DDC227F|nr:hypothetical protein [Actinacidiphila glaucinigra]WSD62793.1 hypothetical protein OIE69_29805 [Actinacidiphila glaucinigra]
MVEWVRTLVEALAQGLPGLRAMREENRRRKLRAELFILHVRLNEAMPEAEGIVRSLEVYRERMGRHLEHGDDAYALTAGGWVARGVQRQIVNLTRISGLMSDHGVALQIIDPDAYNRLQPLLSGKCNALQLLLAIMRSGALPLAPTQEDLTRAMDVGHPRSRDGQDRMMANLREFSPRWHDTALPTSSEWGPTTYECVVRYLRERRPREQLAEIRAASAALRSALEEHFTISDVLLEVGDERMGGGGAGAAASWDDVPREAWAELAAWGSM